MAQLPSIPSIGNDLASHTAALNAIRNILVGLEAAGGPAGALQGALEKGQAGGYPGLAADGSIRLTMNPALVVPALQLILKITQGGLLAGKPEGWHEIGAPGEPAFTNGCVNFGGAIATAAFRKLPTGLVIIKGGVKSFTNNTSIFPLPAGYRPAATHAYEGADLTNLSLVLGTIEIATGGTVKPIQGSVDGVGIATVFFAEA